MNLGLSKKNVFITASTSGIGFATAESFLKEGANVVISGRNQDKLNSAVNILNNRHPENNVYGVQIDATKKESLIEALLFVEEKMGKIDCLVANLGSGKPENTNVFDIDEWKRLFEINLFSSVQLIDAFKDKFKEKGGSIVLMSSIAGINRIGAPVAYAAAKASINTLVTYAAKELSSKNIRINAVAPGNVYFEGGRWEELRNKDIEGTDKYIKEEVPMKRFATPEEIADAVVFLSSCRSSFITGEILVIDGGQNRVI